MIQDHPDHSASNGTNESTLGKVPPVPLMHHDLSDVADPDLDADIPNFATSIASVASTM